MHIRLANRCRYCYISTCCLSYAHGFLYDNIYLNRSGVTIVSLKKQLLRNNYINIFHRILVLKDEGVVLKTIPQRNPTIYKEPWIQ